MWKRKISETPYGFDKIIFFFFLRKSNIDRLREIFISRKLVEILDSYKESCKDNEYILNL